MDINTIEDLQDLFDKGARTKLEAIQKLPADKSYDVWKELDDSTKASITDLLEDFRRKKAAKSRGLKKSVGQTVCHTGERITTNVSCI